MTSSQPTLAVVMPVLNEAAGLPATLESLLAQTEPAERIIVVDGGSGDGTADIARKLGAEVRVAESAGRGNQIGLGVSGAAEDLIVVAHADMIFPRDALATIRRYMQEHPGCPGGSLGHRFDSRRWRYSVVEWFDRRRARRGYSYGDQAQFFRRDLLEFPAQPIMEDVEFATRLRSLGEPAYLDCPVMASTRRFERLGLLRTLWQNRRYRRSYRRGGIAATRAIHEQYYSRKEPAR
jgi:glycosyltransferase involved in cell wall biosynthesis